MKSIVTHEKEIAKKFRENMTELLNERKQIHSKGSTDDKMWGALSILEQGVQDNCQKCIDAAFTEAEMNVFESLAGKQKSNLETIVNYLKLED